MRDSHLLQHFLARLTYALLVVAIVRGEVSVAQSTSGQSDASDQTKTPRRVLVDAYHAHSWIETLPHDELEQYHILHSPARAIGALRQLGWSCDVQISPWTEESLKSCDVVYLNLVSADRPPFTVDEILALDRFVREGGGLFLVTDHTNCYYHNHVLGALADRIGFQLRNELLCDRSPHTTGRGNAWVVLSSCVAHPVTKNIQRIAFQSGGCVDERFGVIHSSPLSWADDPIIPQYGESNAPAFYGDFKQQLHEKSQRHAGVAAWNHEKGKVVVVADQNAIGGLFLNYLDNRQFWLQSMHWLADVEPPENAWAVQETDRGLVWCYEANPCGASGFGDTSPSGLYYFFAWLNKIADCRATDRLNLEPQITFLADLRPLNSDDAMRKFRALLWAGKTIVVLSYRASTKQTESLIEGLTQVRTSIEWDTIGEQWESPGGGRLVFMNNANAWRNEDFPTPETEPLPNNRKRQSIFKSWLFERGLPRYTPPRLGDDWLKELDE